MTPRIRRCCAFRPVLTGSSLEARIAPAGNLAPAQVGNQSGSEVFRARDDSPLAQIHASYINNFQRAYSEFAVNYLEQVQSSLFQGGATGLAANRAEFDANVQNEVNQLSASLGSLLLLSPRAEPSGLVDRLVQSLAGSGPESLVSRLDALPTPYDTTGVSATAFANGAGQAVQQALAYAQAELNEFFRPDNPIRQRVAGEERPPLAQVQDAYARNFQRAFASLADVYARAANSTLFAGGAGQIATNRADFDQEIRSAIGGTQNDLVSQLRLSPRTAAGLVGQIQNLVTGDGPDSLVSRLEALESPMDLAGATASRFAGDASRIINETFLTALQGLNRFFARRSELAPAIPVTPGGGSAPPPSEAPGGGNGNGAGTPFPDLDPEFTGGFSSGLGFGPTQGLGGGTTNPLIPLPTGVGRANLGGRTFGTGATVALGQRSPFLPTGSPAQNPFQVGSGFLGGPIVGRYQLGPSYPSGFTTNFGVGSFGATPNAGLGLSNYGLGLASPIVLPALGGPSGLI